MPSLFYCAGVSSSLFFSFRFFPSGVGWVGGGGIGAMEEVAI